MELDQVRRAHAESVVAAAELKAQLEHVERWRKLLDAVSSAHEVSPAHLHHSIRKVAATLADFESEHGDTVRELRRLEAESEAAAREHAAAAVRLLPEALEARGLTIDTSSRHPRYSVDDHLIEVTVEERDLQALIEMRHGERRRDPLDADVIADHVKAEHERLFDRPWDPIRYRKSLLQAYRRLKSPPEGAALRDIAAAMTPRGRKPDLSEFVVDLSRLLTEQGTNGASIVIRTHQTRDTRRGLLIPGLERGGYVLSLIVEEIT